MLNGNIVPKIELALAEGLEVSLTTRTKENKPGFMMVGNGWETRKNKDSVDLLWEISQMSSNEKLCFFKIKDSMVYSRSDERIIYQVVIDMGDMTPSQKSKFSNGYTSLKQKDLVRRVKKGVYMINPNAIIPAKHTAELTIWNSLKETK